MIKFQTVIKLFKVKNWIKNFLIIIPIFFSTIIPDRQMILELIILFFAFSLSASTIYIFNDILDINTDKLDLIKKNRPLASGLITIKDSIFIILTHSAAKILVVADDHCFFYQYILVI